LTKTESQGIAYQEILSMDVPCFVLDKDVWDDYSGWSFPGTSVPYFDRRCGEKQKSITEFLSFYQRVDQFSPRSFVIENLSLTKQAKEYVNILL